MEQRAPTPQELRDTYRDAKELPEECLAWDEEFTDLGGYITFDKVFLVPIPEILDDEVELLHCLMWHIQRKEIRLSREGLARATAYLADRFAVPDED